MKIIIIALLSFAFLKDASAFTERYYQELDCNSKGGVAEYRLIDRTRIDCLTSEKAIEHDWAKKWAECVGQALYYGAMKDKTPVCSLIGTEEDYYKYSRRIEAIIEHYRLPLEIQFIEK